MRIVRFEGGQNSSGPGVNLFGRVIGYIFWFLFSVVIAWLVKKAFEPKARPSPANAGGAKPGRGAPPQAKPLFRDPVCGTYVAEEASQEWKQGGETLHFCSRECLERYRAANQVAARA